MPRRKRNADAARIERARGQPPLTIVHLKVIALIWLITFLEGFDVGIGSVTAPVIMKEWRLTQLGFSAALAGATIGMAIGAAVGGPLGDRFGRRPIVIASVGIFGASTALCGLSADVSELALFRILSGIGFGACLPPGIALVTECVPKRAISQAVGFVFIGVPVGGMAGAAISAWIIIAFGWPAYFVIGGVAPLLVCALLMLMLPESAAWRAGRSRFPVASAVASSAAVPGRWRRYFVAGNRRVNSGLVLGFFVNSLAIWGLLSWSPTILAGFGVPLGVAMQGSFYFNLAAVVGAITGSLLTAPLGSPRVMLALQGIAAVVIASVWLVLVSSPDADYRSGMTIAVMAGAGFCLMGFQSLLYAVAANAYPVDIRSTGVGVAVTAGRLGSIAAAFGGGAALTLGGAAWFFGLIVALSVVAVIAVVVIDRHIPARAPRPE